MGHGASRLHQAEPRSGFGSNELSGRVSGLIRLARKLSHPLRQDDAREHAGRPDVSGLAKIRGVIQGAALDTQRVSGASPLMPKPRTASTAERTVERISRVGRARPKPGLSLRESQRSLEHDEGDAES